MTTALVPPATQGNAASKPLTNNPHLTAWVEHMGPALDDLRGERYIGSDDEIANMNRLRNALIGHVETRWHLQSPYPR